MIIIDPNSSHFCQQTTSQHSTIEFHQLNHNQHNQQCNAHSNGSHEFFLFHSSNPYQSSKLNNSVPQYATYHLLRITKYKLIMKGEHHTKSKHISHHCQYCDRYDPSQPNTWTNHSLCNCPSHGIGETFYGIGDSFNIKHLTRGTIHTEYKSIYQLSLFFIFFPLVIRLVVQ